MKVRAGVIIIPPPTPVMDPRVPAPKPTMIKSAANTKGSTKHGHVSSLPLVVINHFLFIGIRIRCHSIMSYTYD